mgnify:CR=1 FL=1
MKKCKKLGAERLSEFFRQFSVLVESGLSIPETLEIMQQDDTDREFCLACRKLGAFMTEGKTVGDAMEETGRFPEPAIQMIRAAEMSGQLVRTTARLAVHYEKEHRTEGKIRSAVLYPKILVLMMIFRISGDPADVRADPGGCDAAASYKNPHGDQPFSVCVPLFPASGGRYDPGRMEDPDGKSMVSLQL